jgi:hypothetical protein
MTEDRVERDLAARFRRLRDEDDSRAPAFRTLSQAAGRTAPRGPRRVFLLVAAAAAIPIVVTILMVRRPTEADANAISAWTSPTGSLLDTPGSELYGETPPVAEPIPDWIFEGKAPSSTTPPLSTPAPKGVSS